jgi:lipopolysaccharide assembly outer membrane protein LptD (OstA)
MKWKTYIFLSSTFFIFSSATSQLAAQDPPADTLRNYSYSQETDIDSVIQYEAHDLEAEADSKILRLYGNGMVTFKGMRLSAGLITIDRNENIIIAEPMLDTTATDGGAEERFVGYPVFEEGGEKITGEKMVYNFKTRKGRVIRGRTKLEQGYYTGSTLKKITPKIYFVRGGIFSTCSLEQPHYHFGSSKMKMIQDDRVIGRPVVLYIHGIPLIPLPYIFLPNRKGRHSGILVPRFAFSPTEGRSLRGLGYYWAASEYWDTKVEVDFFEKTGFMLHSTTNYNLRYVLRGSISGSLLHKDFSEERKDRRWDVSFRHSHTISPTANISASGSFVSDASFYQDFSANRQQRLERQIRSNATLTKKWPGSRNSLSVNLSRVQNLDTRSITETFPQASFRHGQEALINLFRSRKEGSSSRPSTSSEQKKWYENIYFSYNNQFLNRRAKTRISEPDSFRVNKFTGLEHNVTLTSPLRLFRYFSLSQSLTYEEIWQDRRKEYFLDEENNRVKSVDKNGFWVRRTFATTLGVNTKLYGMFNISRWGVTAIRHVLTPSVSIQYQPDFSDPGFGYYQEIEDTTGLVSRNDRFSGSVFGSTPRGGRQNMSFSLNNLFQMKSGSGEAEKKFDLFTNSISIGHDFKRDSLKWTSLSSNFRASPSRGFNFTFGMVHSLYEFSQSKGGEVNQFLFEKNIWKPLRLTSLNLTSSLRLNSTMFRFGRGGTAAVVDSTAGEFLDQGRSSPSRFEGDEVGGSGGIPWTANLSFSYRLNRFNPKVVTKTIWLNMSSNIQLTTNWRIGYNARFDVKKAVMVAQDISIYRDLHCWEARFVWTPTGPFRRFYLKINIKSSLLRDIKLEKRGGKTTIYDF